MKRKSNKSKGGKSTTYFESKSSKAVSRGINTLNPSKKQEMGSGLQTGVPNGHLVNPRQKASSSPGVFTFYTPLHMYGALFSATGYLSSFADNVFRDSIYPIYRSGLQKNLNFNLNLSLDDLTGFFESICDALQLYYTVDSVIQYTNDPQTQNFGVDSIRERLTSDVLVYHERLKMRLEQLAVPPNLVKTIHWIHQIYSSSPDAVGAPLFKINFGGTFFKYNDINSKFGDLNANTYQAIFTDLDQRQQWASYLSKAIPEWTIGNLPPSKSNATYDSNFLSLWVNLNTVAVDSDSTLSSEPSLSNIEGNYPYFAFTNDLDGGTVCLSNIAIPSGALNIYQPGYLIPFDLLSYGGDDRTSLTNRHYVTEEGEIEEWKSNYNENIAGSAMALYRFQWLVPDNDVRFVSGCIGGAQKILDFSPSQLRAPVNEFADWLFNADRFKTLPKSYF